MPRLRQVHSHEITDPVVKYMYQRKYGDRDPVDEPGTATGARGDWETVFALVPVVFEHIVRGFALYQSPELCLDPSLRELVVARVGWASGSQFVFSQHCKSFRAEGGSDEKVESIPYWEVSEAFSPLERSVLAYVDCLITAHGRVPDGIFSAVKAEFSDEEILELTYFASMYLMYAVMTRALQLEFDDRDDPVVEVPAPSGFNVELLSSRFRRPFVVPERDGASGQ